jgi:FkbM family methyltransferase
LKWYDDSALVGGLPLRYRLYARYSRAVGDNGSRRVPGGSFLLRALRAVSNALRLSTVAPVRGIDGLVVLADFGDERILDVLHEIRGENPEYAMMKQTLSTGDTFIDVGANFGTFSLLASRLVGSSGQVFAIEPQPRLAGMVGQSFTMSSADNCVVMPVACGSKRKTMQLLIPHDDSGRAGFFSGFSGQTRHRRLDVNVMPLDDLLPSIEHSERVFLKIDVEGSEFDVIEGARRMIAARRPAMMIELNPWSAQSAGRRPGDLIELLMTLGYSSFATPQSFPATEDVPRIDLSKQTNILALM